MKKQKKRTNNPSANPDPITKAPGSHPVGTGVGAAAGGAAGVGGAIAAGAAMGSAVGPVGTAVGAAVGAVAGGLVGKGVAESINPSVEHDYWRSQYSSRPYSDPDISYEDYAPAYQYGWESQSRHPDRRFEDVESDLAREWERAKEATRDAWNRVASKENKK